MKIEKIRELSATELNNELVKMKKELFNLRFQHVTGQLENPIKMRDVKKGIARVKTVIRENEIKNAQG
jgi:large subunit ribosomal protein L29